MARATAAMSRDATGNRWSAEAPVIVGELSRTYSRFIVADAGLLSPSAWPVM